MRTAIYPGSFDPLTRGHLDVIRRLATLFDRVIVAAGANPAKRHLFTIEERVAMIGRETRAIRNVRVLSFDGLLIDFARAHAPAVIVRGLRSAGEFDIEYQMALTNRAASGVETLFLPPSAPFAYHSGRFIRELAARGAPLGEFLTPAIARLLKNRLAREPRP
ncbi:MAG TPA: pantetheine-phosphate adenylyltransferase [Candidatus Brocadiia bacterium]|nr:pantetheine-phosphate adenylyltransferase [Candidatus Brocadiia bacterium]